MRTVRSAAAAAALLLTAATSAFGVFVPNALTGVTGIPYNQGDSGTLNADGNIARVFNGGGLAVGNPANSSTWTHESSWQNGWQGNSTTGTLIADLGSNVPSLQNMYVWNVTEGGAALTRGTKTMDVYYATTPTVNPVAGSAYNFASGGWTLLASAVNVTIGDGSGASPINATVNLSSIPQARYIGLNLLENQGSTSPARIGFAEIQFTTVPEPTAAAASLALATAGLAARRRRQR